MISCNNRWFGTVAVLALSLGTAHAVNATIVTSPTGTVTGTSDTFVTDSWFRTNVRSGGTTGITADYPRDTNGSAYFYGIFTDTTGNDKADWKYESSTGYGPLSQLTSVTYDWYRDSSSTVPAHYHPAIRIMLRDAEDPSIRRKLVFELAYNPAVTPVTTDAWVTQMVDDNAHVWNVDAAPYKTLATCKAATLPNTEGVDINSANFCWGVLGTDIVMGIEVGIGSWWATAEGQFFKGAADDVKLVMDGQEVLNANFELPAPPVAAPVSVPTMSEFGLVALGTLLAGSAFVRRRRRKD